QENSAQRDLQKEVLAHIEVQGWLDEEDGPAASRDAGWPAASDVPQWPCSRVWIWCCACSSGDV
ncbi:MAG TPA: hypothetical protein V6D20_24995, partial [Candidatus Obscuribacterales bacterium]